jgi:CheY-like chemotaxis protein
MSRHYVLVVDDDSDVRELMADLLRHRGYDVEQVSDGAQALAALRTAAPCVVLLDLVLPGSIDGWGVLMEMKNDPALREIPVWVVSGHAHGLPPDTLLLPKPVAFSDLRQAVERFCAPSLPPTAAAGDRSMSP